MPWDYIRSKERIKKHLDNMGEIQVEKLTKDADLSSLLSETCCREIYGAHIYVNVSNFARLASELINDADRYKELIQAVHIYQREVSRIVEGEGIFDGVRIHFQGSKLHALFFRPIDNGPKIAAKAVLLQLVLKDFVASVLILPFRNLMISKWRAVRTSAKRLARKMAAEAIANFYFWERLRTTPRKSLVHKGVCD